MATGRLPDPNTAPLTAKGDLYTYSTVPARLAVGSNGDTLVADSSATTGLRWQGNFAAGKNKIINGDLYINQRAFTSTTTNEIYTFDRFRTRITGDGTATYTAQTFTPGTAPVTGYEAVNYIRIVTASQTSTAVRTIFRQSIEDVRTLAGQTVTFSFWAKANSGTPKIAGLLVQNFGSGGSSAVDNPLGLVTISTSWARYSFTTTLPSLSGKTIGTSSQILVDLCVSAGSDLNTPYSSIGIQSNTFDIWGLQLESGSIATAFQTATGTLQGELAACQRYYFRMTGDPSAAYPVFGTGWAVNADGVHSYVKHPVTMRIEPTSLDTGNLAAYDGNNVIGTPTNVTFNSALQSRDYTLVVFEKAASFTQYRPYALVGNNNTAAFLGLSAEF